jgi:hypothetical protein
MAQNSQVGPAVWQFGSLACQRQEASLQHTLAKLMTVGMQSINVFSY